MTDKINDSNNFNNIHNSKTEIENSKANSLNHNVAIKLINGDIADGIVLLSDNNSLRADNTLKESINQLINDWKNSKFEPQDRLIIAGHKEAENINQNIRNYMKENGALKGPEYSILISGAESKKYANYMAGDRIVFQTNDKDLQIQNSEFATLVSIDENKFVAKTDTGNEVSFDLNKISFKHGYATTVCNPQTAVKKDVYVLHNNGVGIESSNISMIGNAEQVRLYYNVQATKNVANLIEQLSTAKTDSINSKEENNDVQANEVRQYQSAQNYRKNDYYSNSEEDLQKLRDAIAYRADTIARDILGDPNNRLSRHGRLRWGDTGKIQVTTEDKYAGKWYDFSTGQKGDLLSLVQIKRGYSFFEAKEYLKSMVGMSNISQRYQKRPKTDDSQQYTQQPESVKIAKVQNLYELSSKIHGYDIDKNPHAEVVNKYLENRGITFDKSTASSDLKASILFDTQTRENYPAFTAFARNSKGEITGVQAVYLNLAGDKANISINRRSFGKISGSFITIAKRNANDPNITIIAEGAETALSLQQSGIKGNIIASAGISNLTNYSPFPGEKIIIAADNDSKNSITNNTVIKAAKMLEMKGAITCIIKPPENGDFNNLLQSCGDQSIRDIIEPEITKLTKAIETTKLTQTENNSIAKQNDITNVKELYNKSSSLYYFKQEEEAKVETIVVNKYLENHTGIYSAKIFNNSNLRANMVFDEETQKSWPALTIFVKNEAGEITGAKILTLNSKTCNKADIPEKSVGTISGSFAEIAQQNSKYSPVTIITKDIETALTIRQAGVEGKILCAIEAENLQNYNPGPKEKIILAVKNDVNTEKAEKVLEDKEAVVCTVKNDFNNVLKTQGLYAVRNIISPEIRKLNEKIESIQTNIQPGLCPKH
ncbi:toprim domain-containing protein [Orientia tsutsugamushi]|uniref:Conjugal transfer protein TraI n=2 Tax=Orientia tsutsugamushi TaxID=784 RepID=A0A2U3QPP9_ORITS|nr:toprim domain-containing protein [Orientia tsutsugamushi]SPR02918.1 conjugal transfer protein TraI [Orientia tsutsugamushi]SPR11144.1 conjugal transfer protein TraI [Orientia tsutsugamushi]